MIYLTAYLFFVEVDFYRVTSHNYIHHYNIHFFHRYNTDTFPLIEISVRGRS